ncbi:MAG TPA: RnfABCDGE type electron transport complex subunit D [Firmicutes bacterium]|nr:RnfABCDGE type electron transport complex subunit D [Bacillota bacterium]
MEKLDNLVVSSSPHLRSGADVEKMMWHVNLALLPAILLSVYFFGFRALAIIILSIAAAVVTEGIIQKATGKEVLIADGSAVVTGLLLGLNMPVHVPLWLPVIGSVFAIAVVKQAFGGLGSNFMNPALAARAAMLAAWPVHMTSYAVPFVDGITHATPLSILSGAAHGELPSYLDLFIGNVGGVIGETSALALLAGGVYLFVKGVIDWRTPTGFLGTVFILTWIFGGNAGLFTGDPLYHLLAGGLMLGAFYMATDYVTSPVTKKGRLLMGIGAGAITVMIRLWGGYPEGVTYGILLMNIATPLLDRYTVPRIYGTVRK